MNRDDLIERLKDLSHKIPGAYTPVIQDAIAALSPVLPDQCEHEWIDPSNEAVDAGEYRLCLKCRSIAIPEAPVLPDEVVQHVRHIITIAATCGEPVDTTLRLSADLIERLARDRDLALKNSIAISDDHTDIQEKLERLNLTLQEKLSSARDAKRKHKNSNQCEREAGKGCTACHFWSGQISAYSELLGEPGVID